MSLIFNKTKTGSKFPTNKYCLEKYIYDKTFASNNFMILRNLEIHYAKINFYHSKNLITYHCNCFLWPSTYTYIYSSINTTSPTVVRSKHLRRWWCCNSKMSSSRPASSSSTPDSWAARRASAAFFLDTKAAPDEALAIRMRARRAFWNSAGNFL